MLSVKVINKLNDIKAAELVPTFSRLNPIGCM